MSIQIWRGYSQYNLFYFNILFPLLGDQSFYILNWPQRKEFPSEKATVYIHLHAVSSL
jgi:hypothetical protein